MASHEDRMTLVMARGHIAGMPEDDQARVRGAAEAIRAVVSERGAPAALGLALVAAEIGAGELKVPS